MTPMSNDLHATVASQLRRTRQRYTLGRRQLVDLLVEIGRPVTIPDLIERGAKQSQSSLYRNLAILEQCGTVRRLLSTDDVARYELAEELSEHHHHLVCSVCGDIEDVTLPDEFEESLRAAAQDASARTDFEVDTHRFELLGTCGDCG